MMSKKLFIAFAVIVAVIIIFNLLSQLGLLRVFQNQTSANEPNLKTGSFYVSTNLLKPERGDIITYFYNDTLFGPGLFVHRICGVAEDTIEIKNSTLYVNGNNFDTNLDLKHNYKLSSSELKIIPYEMINDPNGLHLKLNDSTHLISLEDNFAERNNFRINSKSKNISNDEIKKKFDLDWNRDNFGPIIIPHNKIFVLGDNRHNSDDSRYKGLIDKNDIKGKVLFK